MSQILSLLSLVAALAAGMLAGRVTKIAEFQKTRRFAMMRSAVLFFLIFTMGFRMGRTPPANRRSWNNSH